MAVTLPPFTTTASITGSTLISNADEQLNILMTDVENYVEATYQTVATNLEGTVGIHVTTASNFAAQAEASATSVLSSATSALSSANSAGISEANALSYKNSAQTHATNAGISEANALSYKNSAQASAESAATSAYDASVNAAAVAAHLGNTVNPHNITASQINLGNVTNTSDYAKPIIGFTLDNTVAPNVGQVAWNIDENTLDVGLNGASLLLGQDQLIRVRNSTASTISNGTAVMATGTIGNSGRITVAPANINSNNAKFILGIVTESIVAGADGFCVVFGKVRHINTSGSLYGETWADGDTIYVKPNDTGALTNITPTSTQVKLPIAIVIKAHASAGTLFVRVTPIDENHAEIGLATKASLNQVIALAIALGLSQNEIDAILANNP